MLAAKAADLQ